MFDDQPEMFREETLDYKSTGECSICGDPTDVREEICGECELEEEILEDMGFDDYEDIYGASPRT